MTEQEQNRAQDAGEAGQGGEEDKGSQDRQEVAGTIKEAAGQAAGQAKDTAGQAKDKLESVAQNPAIDFRTVLREAQKIIADEVKAGITQAASETVAPAARQAATSAVIYMANKAPGLVTNVVRESVAPKLKDAGGAKAVAGTVLGKFPGLVTKFPGALAKGPAGAVGGAIGSMFTRGNRGQGGGGGGGGGDLSGVGRGRRLPMQAAIDVSVPAEVAYNQWTQFEEFPKFMFRVERIEQKDDTHLIWHEKIWGVRRQWEAEIVEQRPNERIVWKSLSGPQHIGVINFHQLHDPRLSRVQVNLDFQPTGLIEKTGRGWRAAIRALDTDLQRFKAFVEMKEAATGAWRGRVKDGEVQQQEEGQEDGGQAAGEAEQAEAQQPEAEQAEAEQPEAEQAQAEQAQAEQPEGEQPEDGEQPEGEQGQQAEAPSEGEAQAQAPAADEESEPVVPERSQRGA
ncbi:MAG TPA: SRPBCC family protein [Actinomycetes bacterium]